MKALLRACAQLVALAAAGCCTGSSAVAPPEPPAPAPVAPIAADVPQPECLAYCHRALVCHAELGTQPRDTERDCQTACAPGGAHAVLTPGTWACSMRDTCNDFWACSTLGMVQRLVGSLETETPLGTTPADWPADFPLVPGGTARPSPPMGPVHVAVVAYADRTPAELAEAYRTALAAAGWMVPPITADPSDEAVRFVAVRQGTSVSVSLYTEDEHTYVQTMQLGALLLGH